MRRVNEEGSVNILTVIPVKTIEQLWHRRERRRRMEMLHRANDDSPWVKELTHFELCIRLGTFKTL